MKLTDKQMKIRKGIQESFDETIKGVDLKNPTKEQIEQCRKAIDEFYDKMKDELTGDEKIMITAHYSGLDHLEDKNETNG